MKLLVNYYRKLKSQAEVGLAGLKQISFKTPRKCESTENRSLAIRLLKGEPDKVASKQKRKHGAYFLNVGC